MSEIMKEKGLCPYCGSPWICPTFSYDVQYLEHEVEYFPGIVRVEKIRIAEYRIWKCPDCHKKFNMGE